MAGCQWLAMYIMENSASVGCAVLNASFVLSKKGRSNYFANTVTFFMSKYKPGRLSSLASTVR